MGLSTWLSTSCFFEGALDGVDKCFSGAVGAKSRTKWFEEEGGGVHLSG